MPKVERKSSPLVLPYLEIIYLRARTKLGRVIKGCCSCKLQIAFNCQTTLSNFYLIKRHYNRISISGNGSKFQCGLCIESCYDKSMRQLDIRSGEHIGMSPLFGRKVKPVNGSAIFDHLFLCWFIRTKSIH